MRGENFLALLLGILEGMEMQVPKNFVAEPYDYHQEIEFEIESLTNLGMGLGRLDGWVVMVPYVLPGERVRARVAIFLSLLLELCFCLLELVALVLLCFRALLLLHSGPTLHHSSQFDIVTSLA